LNIEKRPATNPFMIEKRLAIANKVENGPDIEAIIATNLSKI
jgi:hypothetical protein